MRQFAGGKNNFKTICSLLLASKIWHTTATVSYSTYVDVTCIQRCLSKIRILLGRYHNVRFLVYYWVIKPILLFVTYYFSFLTYFQDRCFCGKTHVVGVSYLKGKRLSFFLVSCKLMLFIFRMPVNCKIKPRVQWPDFVGKNISWEREDLNCDSSEKGTKLLKRLDLYCLVLPFYALNLFGMNDEWKWKIRAIVFSNQLLPPNKNKNIGGNNVSHNND